MAVVCAREDVCYACYAPALTIYLPCETSGMAFATTQTGKVAGHTMGEVRSLNALFGKHTDTKTSTTNLNLLGLRDYGRDITIKQFYDRKLPSKR